MQMFSLIFCFFGNNHYLCIVFFTEHDLFLLKFQLESPPRKGKRAINQIRFGVRTKSVSSPYLFGACGEPELDMAGMHSFHILKLVLTVED